MIKSPLNYPGNKYKLLKQLLPLFPKDISTFVDLFGGSGTVMANVEADNYIYNEYNTWVYKIIKMFLETESNDLLSQVKEAMKERDLVRGNKEAFLKLREDFNSGNKTPLNLYLLSCFCFSNQIRFNSKGEFNTPFAGDRQFSSIMEKNIPLIYDFFYNKSILMLNEDFGKVEIPDNSFVYVDPPYLGTVAVYNEQGGWDREKEQRMYNFLDTLTNRGIKWAVSNDLSKNPMILYWAQERYTIIDLNYDYSKSSYHSKREFGSTKEVLITNYEG